MSLARVCVITTVVCAQTLLEPSRSAAQEPPAQAQDSLIEAVEQLAADPPTASSVARRILALQDSLEAS